MDSPRLPKEVRAKSCKHLPQKAFCASEIIDGFLVSHISVAISNLADELDGLRLLQLTDLHYGPSTSRAHLERAIQIAAPIAPDVLLLTGDYLQLSSLELLKLFQIKERRTYKYARSAYRKIVREHSEKLQDMLSVISAPLGTYAVLGNHDYLEGAPIITSRMGGRIKWLTNTCSSINVGNSAIHIAGVDDWRHGSADLELVANKISVATSQQAGPKILLSHNPDVVLHPDKNHLEDYNLILCGHTHGGQIRLPKLGALTTQTSQSDHVKGLTHFGSTPIYVSSGVGYGGIAIRLNCPPEIVVIELCNLEKLGCN